MATYQQTFDFLKTPVAARPAPPAGMEFRLSERSDDRVGDQLDRVGDQLDRVGDQLDDATTRPTASGLSESTASDLSRSTVLDRLRAQVGCLQMPECLQMPDAGDAEWWSTGCRGIDDLLPRGGLRSGAITEWVSDGNGCGAAALSMIAAARFMQPRGDGEIGSRGPLVVVSGCHSRRQGCFYPPAAVALGIPAERMIWVRSVRHADLVWAIDQALRCQSVAAVWAHVGAGLDDRDARRFQLAAERGRTPGLFVRPASTRGRPSFADTRFHVGNGQRSGNGGVRSGKGEVGSGKEFFLPHSSHFLLQVTLDRCRGGVVGRSVWVQIDDRARVRLVPSDPVASQEGIGDHEAAAVRLVSELAHPKNSNRQANRRRA